ncbi:dihydrofolate reductase [Halopseudomonas xinjiangensis]|uniref:Dihydrofolate reductase n=1 Tax=Halopseudomonas xinjiangensis TaxID=487184 RepID=A0A1H1LC88_9GAMM|nr:dihydrofolate reductase [Halopseudomonas xinjiangensis]SDR72113.1 dihydrofolate reductase [Halopseudomonas xinjiangensis]
MSPKTVPKISMIAALARNRVIGRDNQLPWHLPEDLKYFRSVTWGKPIIMGRKTFDSLGRPLPGRTNIVVTGQAGLELAGARVTASLDEALKLAVAQAELDAVDEVMVIGGATIYQQLLDRAGRLYLTKVDAAPDGDAWFPDFDEGQWKVTSERSVEAGDAYPAHCYQVLDRLED